MNYSKEVINQFKQFATASVADAVEEVAGKRGYMEGSIKPRITEENIVGPAVTVYEVPTDEKLPPQHALQAIDEASPGDVLVIGLEDDKKDVATWGGLMTAGAVVNELAGTILDAGVRDVTEIKNDFGYQVFSRSISPGTTVGRFKTEAMNVPVLCGGIEVHPGDLIVGDADGVIVVPRDSVDEVMKAAIDIEEREAEQTKLIKKEKSLLKGLEKFNRI